MVGIKYLVISLPCKTHFLCFGNGHMGNDEVNETHEVCFM